ncbi:MAG: SDR family NAD(P)-dependent oxidoreductase [Pikeienuella sp.]|uniref:SDR family NAD(P)-dependent oxidoreductase n=1 Tax=Pikeienuella sp. TaxID=2831957 RepID=UPI00391BBF0D
MSVWSKRMRPADGAAWVTGASAGIGRAVALRLADEGWTVWATARRADALEALAAERPGKILPLPCDVTDRGGMAAAVAAITAEGPLALAILNAGLYIPLRAQEFDAGKAAKTFDVNLNGVANGLDPVLKHMIGRRDGHVAITASVAGYRGLPRAAAYGATKSALITMAEALAFDLIDLDVRISVINPGFVKTDATSVNDFEMPFVIPADEAAKRIVEGLKKPGFEIAFPRRFEILLKTIGLLPNRAYLAVMRKLMGWDERVK